MALPSKEISQFHNLRSVKAGRGVSCIRKVAGLIDNALASIISGAVDNYSFITTKAREKAN